MKNKILDHLHENWIRHGFETIVVIVGILVAFGLNNWNENRKERNREKELLKELVLNLEANVFNLKNDIVKQKEQIKEIESLLNHLENKRAYVDSLANQFKSMEVVPDIVLASSAFETLRSSGLDLIHQSALRKNIVELFEITYPYLLLGTKRLEDQMWPAVVLPLTTKYFRYHSELPTIVNYPEMLEDATFLNMISSRLQLRHESTALKQVALEKTQEVIDMIRNEIQQ